MSKEKSFVLNVQIPTVENIEYCTFKKKPFSTDSEFVCLSSTITP